MTTTKYVAGAFAAGALAVGAVASASGGRLPGASTEAMSRPAATAPAPLPREPIATVTGSDEDTRAMLFGLRRTGTKVVTATLRIASDRDEYFGWRPRLEGDDGRWDTAEGLRLVDEVNGREHLPLQGPDGCLCSTNIAAIEQGESIGVYAKFPAPPDDVDRMSLHVPGFQSFDDVPLS